MTEIKPYVSMLDKDNFVRVREQDGNSYDRRGWNNASAPLRIDHSLRGAWRHPLDSRLFPGLLGAGSAAAGKECSGKGAASMVTEAVYTAKAAGPTKILVRGDSAYGNGKVIPAVVKAGATSEQRINIHQHQFLDTIQHPGARRQRNKCPRNTAAICRV